MRLDVLQASAFGVDERLQCPELIQRQLVSLSRRDRDLAPAEALQIGQARMGPDRHALAHAQLHRAAHGCGIACVEPAGDVGGADVVQQLSIAAEAIGAKAFAHVTIQVNAQHDETLHFNEH
ncbi:hypothetical protein D3C72_2003510 [compost metagenome]